MNKNETIKKLNALIDEAIIKGQTKTAEYKRMCKLHKKLIKN